MPYKHPAKAAERMTGLRIRRRIGWSRRVTTLPPDKQQPGDNHNQCDLEHQADEGGEAAHAAEKPMPEEKAEQAGAEEASGETAEQPATEQAGSRRRLADSVRFAGLRKRALHWRCGIRRSLGGRGSGESACTTAAAGEAPTSAGMCVRGNEEAHDYRSNRHYKTASDHCSPPGKSQQRISIGTSICKGLARATKSRRISGHYHGKIIR